MVLGGVSFDLAGPHGQDRLRAVERLNLTLFIHAQDQSINRRAHVKAHNIAHFFDEIGILGYLKVFPAMRFQSKSAPDAADCGLA